jgi:hypothetical protein
MTREKKKRICNIPKQIWITVTRPGYWKLGVLEDWKKIWGLTTFTGYCEIKPLMQKDKMLQIVYVKVKTTNYWLQFT